MNSNEPICRATGRIVWLPPQLADWATRLVRNVEPEQAGYADYPAKSSFSAKLDLSPHLGEYLLLLQRTSNEWNIESVHNLWGLTFREAEILMWISRGKTNKEIGMILDCSPRTVNKHLEHIFEKLGVVTRAAAVTKVLQPRVPDS